MENEKKCCGFFGHIWYRKVEILGVVLVVLASVASLLSFSGLGLLGMLLVGWGLISRHCMKCRCSSCCYEGCEDKNCETTAGDVCEIKPVKKTKAKAK
jgi:hypothetical protein